MPALGPHKGCPSCSLWRLLIVKLSSMNVMSTCDGHLIVKLIFVTSDIRGTRCPLY